MEVKSGVCSRQPAYKKEEQHILLEKTFENDAAARSHIKFKKYIEGVNKRSSNCAVVFELGRYPMYVSVVLSMLKYYYRF